MPQKAWLILSLAFSLCGCAHGPKVAVCVSDPASMGFQCYDARTGQRYFLSYQDSENYVSFSPTDARTLMNYCGRGR